MVPSNSCSLCSRTVPTLAFWSAAASCAALAALTLRPLPPGPGADAAAVAGLPSGAGSGAAAPGASGGCCTHASLKVHDGCGCRIAVGACTGDKRIHVQAAAQRGTVLSTVHTSCSCDTCRMSCAVAAVDSVLSGAAAVRFGFTDSGTGAAVTTVEPCSCLRGAPPCLAACARRVAMTKP